MPSPPFKYVHLETVDSTNRYLADFLSKTSPEDGFCVFSDFQTEGKGQYGRNWLSEPGANILVSFAFRTDWIRDRDFFSLNQIASLAVLQVLRNHLPHRDISIKWPNDLLCDGHKIAGILIQNVFRGSELTWSVIGIGLNANQRSFEPGLNATSMALASGKSFDRLDILKEMHGILAGLVNRRRDGGFSELSAHYNDNLFGKNRPLCFERKDGSRFTATLLGVDDGGRIFYDLSGKVCSTDWTDTRIVMPS